MWEFIIKTGILFYIDGSKRLYSDEPSLAEKIGIHGSPLEILISRFKALSQIDGFALAIPEDTADVQALSSQAEALSINIHKFDSSIIIEKPIDILQQYWGLEDDEGHDTWVGSVFADAAKKERWDTVILIPLVNLLVSSKDVWESLQLHSSEGFDVCYSEERQTGANWIIFQAELLTGLNKNHEELMRTRGGLSWAIRKPLYPFKIGAYHCPRIRPSIQADLRLNSLRSKIIYNNTFYNAFASPEFSYENWLNTSSWEKLFYDISPKKINIEPTNACDASCKGCPHSEMKRAQGMMALDIFNKILRDFTLTKDLQWEYSGMGEPLLNPHLADMINATKSFHTMLVTSLSKMPSDDFPTKELNMIRISVDALEQEKFDENRIGCNWKNIEDYLHKTYREKCSEKNMLPAIGVTFVKHGHNEQYSQAFLNYWKQVVTPIFKQNFFRWPFEEEPSRIQWYQILGYNSLMGGKEFEPKNSYLPVKRRPCRHALLEMNIQWDGTVVACPFDYDANRKLGNINEQSPLEIWKSSNYRDFRDQHLKMEFPEDSPCKDCKDWYHQ